MICLIEQYILDYINKNDYDYTREIGRYWATDIYSIENGYLKPESFFEKSDFNPYVCRMIISGIAMENMLSKILDRCNVDCKKQEKRIIDITDEISLVVKPDYVFNDKVWETKYPFKLKEWNVIPDRYKFQLECEYRAFELPVFLGMFYNPFNVKFIEYKPCNQRWLDIKTMLIDFHSKLKKEVKNE